MTSYTCPACDTEQTGTIYRAATGNHHCPDCDAEIATTQSDLDWT